jgi:hypothetical protein
MEFAITLPLVGDGKPWPRRLEPFDSVIAYANIDPHLLSLLPKLKTAYADTATGYKATGHSPALRQITKLGAIPECPRQRSTKSLPGYLNIHDFEAESEVSTGTSPYGVLVRSLALVLGLLIIWSGSHYARDLVSGFAREHDLATIYSLVATVSALFGPLLLFVSFTGRVPRWMARVNDPTQAR